MSEAGFFVRMRGKISGPFDVEALQRMVRTGSLSRVHEVSADRAKWVRAAEYEELFPGAPVRAAAARHSSAEAPEIAPESEAIAVSPAYAVSSSGGMDRFFYSQNGAAIGPVSLSVLKLLTQNGTLAGEDMVWRDEADSATPARQVPALAALFSTVTASAWAPVPMTPATNSQQERACQSALQRAASASAAGGIVGGGLLLVCLLLPWFAAPTGLVWWWDLYQRNGDGVWAAACTYLLMCGVALCVIGPITRGVARGICYVSLAGLAALFISIATLRSNPSADGPIGLLMPLALAGIVGVCAARAVVPKMMSARVLLGIFCGIVALGIITGCIQLAANDVTLKRAPGEVVAGVVIIVIGALAALAASITGFIGLKPTFSPGLNLATRILALAGASVPLLGIYVIFLGFIHLPDHPFSGVGDDDVLGVNFRFQIGQAVLRFIVMWCALLMVVGIGLYELLLAAGVRSKLHVRA